MAGTPILKRITINKIVLGLGSVFGFAVSPFETTKYWKRPTFGCFMLLRCLLRSIYKPKGKWFGVKDHESVVKNCWDSVAFSGFAVSPFEAEYLMLTMQSDYGWFTY